MFSQNDGEAYYYQQIVIHHKLRINQTFEDARGTRSWREYYTYLVDQNAIPVRDPNVSSLNDVSDTERGIEVAKIELDLMFQQSFPSQKKIFYRVIRDLKLNSCAFVSGAAGTGKSFLLKMFERHYRIQGYHVFKLAPTGVAAHNIGGQTLHRFFGMVNEEEIVNMSRLREHVEIYRKSVLLIDEYSMISKSLLDKINSALLKTTTRNTAMGGMRTIFFGDFAQLPPVLKNLTLQQAKQESLWKSTIYNHSNRYNLVDPIRQRDPIFVEILEFVRIAKFNTRVANFIISRTVSKNELPLNCLRLYTERKYAEKANTQDLTAFPGETFVIESWDYYTCAEHTAMAALRETRLSRTLCLKIGIPVMLLQNLNVNAGWVNGTIATIFSIDEENIGIEKFVDGETKRYWVHRVMRTVTKTNYTRKQFPLFPAFASTIHKAQSATIDCVAIHLENMPDHGQLYVAMSRVRRAEDLFFFGVNLPISTKKRFRVDWDAMEIIRENIKRGKM